MQCPKCQHENREEAKFCEECGTKLQNVCTECGEELRPQAKFCDECGTRVAEVAPKPPADEVPKLEDMQQQLQIRIPQSLIDKLFAGAKEMQGEHRLVTAVFADVVGSSGMARNMQLDQYVDTMNDCFKMMVDTISIEYEGSINRFIGDCVLAFFGAPITHENDAERSILAALAIRDSVKGLELNVSIGINTGMTYVGEMGSDLVYSERSAWGPDVDFAKRLQEAAAPGEIYVGASTHRLTSRAFDFGPPVNIQVKGVDETQMAYPVLRVREHPEKLRGIEGLKARMIGREKELAALIDCADELMNQRRGQIASIIGEAGIGKSRLVGELGEYVMGKDVQWLEGRCLSIGQSVSFWPFIDMMRTYLDISGEDGESAVANKLIQGMTDLFGPEADGIIPYVGHMLSTKLDDRYQELIRHASPEQVRRQTLLRMRDVFVALARRRPLVMILEDMHWADDLSLDLLWILLDELVAAPMLVVCVHRLDRAHGSWQIGSVASNKHLERYTQLPLNPLTHDQTQQMVESLLDIKDLPSEAKNAILEKTEGNPFFVEEVIRLFIENDDIYYEDGRWKAKDTISELMVPDTIQSVVLARIDRLQEEVKYVLQCASVIGRVFQRRLLGYLAGQEEHMEDHISQLESSELVYKERVVPELEYAFKHALTQETTYQRMITRQQRVFHERVGEGIETLYGEQIEEYYERLAYHYSHSDNNKKAMEYLVKAGQKAANQYANQEALDYFQQALDRVEPGADYDGILEHRAKLLSSMFRGEEAASGYQHLLDSAKASGDAKLELEAILGLAWANYIMALDTPESDYAFKCRELYEEAYTFARRIGDKASMARALIPNTYFTDFWPGYWDQAETNLKEAVALSQEVGDEDLIIDARIVFSRFLNPLETVKEIEDLRELLTERNDLVRLKEVCWRSMWVYRYLGEFEKCVEVCDTGIRLAEELGVPPVQYPTLKSLALLDLGRYDAAWEAIQAEVTSEGHLFGLAMQDMGIAAYSMELMAYERASEMLRNVILQAERLKRIWMQNWANKRLAEGLARAERLDEESLDKINQDLASLSEKLPDITLARFALSTGKLDEALEYAVEAFSDAENNGYRPNQASSLELQARILMQMDKPEDALARADNGIKMADDMSYLSMLWRLRGTKARILERLNRSEEATQEFAAAAEIIQKLADTVPDAELKQGFLSNPLVASIIAASDR